MIARALKLLVGGVLLVYPLGVYAAQYWLTPAQLLAGLAIVFGLRMVLVAWLTREHIWGNNLAAAGLIIAGIIIVSVAPAVPMQGLRFYPAVMDFAVAGVFIGSLWWGVPVAERFARLVSHDVFTPAHARYARHVTQGWGALMVLIGLFSIYTTVATSFEFWSLFNGALVYAVMAGAFGVEYALRCHVKRRWASA